MHPTASILAVVFTAALATAQTVFSTDFEAALPSEITPGTALQTGVQGFAGLGPTGNQFAGSFLRSETGNVVTVSLNSLPAHDTIHLDFLFAAIDSLDGTGTYPSGDYFKITVDGVTVFREAFANALTSQIQTYVAPPGVELARHQVLGFTAGYFYSDSAYYLGGDPFFASIAHSGTTATISFTIEGPGIQMLSDESWAMENLRVHVASNSPGTSAPYGLSCGPVLTATSAPRIGTSLNLSLANLPANTVLAFAGFGLSSAQFGAFVLPYPLDAYGMPGCWLVQDLSLTTTYPFVLGTGGATSSVAIPNDLGFVGLQMFGQGWAITPAANSRNVIFSNGLRVRVGT